MKRLKQGDGPNLVTQGSTELVHALLANDLADAMSIFTLPVVLGGGTKLFADGSAPHAFTLTRSRVSPHGLIVGHYEREGKIRIGDTALYSTERSRGRPPHIPLTTTARGVHMKRVTGIGGIFFKAKDAPSLQAWYKRHLGIDVQVWGGAAFPWADAEGKPVAGTTAWLIAPQESKQFAPSSAPFMVNYRVEDVHALVKALKEEGCQVLEKIDDSEYGTFAWVIDPEGNKVELWQPPAGQ